MLKTVQEVGFGVLVVGFLAASPGFAQESEDEIKKDIEALKQGQRAIYQQLNEIKKLLQEQREPAPRAGQVKDMIFDISGNAIEGQNTAKLTLIEFTDYQ